MPIHPLPQFEADLKLQDDDRKVYESLKAPKTLVVRFGAMKLVGEFPYDGSIKPGCGSKVVVRTQRGTEIGEMLTSTCPNSGCSKSVSRQDMLKYIENSGGRDYPFFTEGRVLRVATPEDMERQTKVEQSGHELKMIARRHAEALGLPMKVVDSEPILGGERVFFYYQSEQRLDFRDLGRLVGQDVHTRVEFRQVGARDEARLTADYEKCGQHCCCKNFLKVLKPISMKSAKIQKATLDPLKISGRCGRLMCCLRYEDETYESLRKKLPKKKSRVGTPLGDGTVVDGQILTQLVLVRLDEPDKDGKIADVAVPVEELTAPNSATPPPMPALRPEGRSDGRPDARTDTRPARRGSDPRSPGGPPRREPGLPSDRPPRDLAPQDRGQASRSPNARGPERSRSRPPLPPRDDQGISTNLDDIPGDEFPAQNPQPRTPEAGQPPNDAPRRGRRRRRRGGGGGNSGGGPNPGNERPPQAPTSGPPPGA